MMLVKKQTWDDCFLIGYGQINNINVTIAAQNFHFHSGGSVGASAAEAMIKAAEHSVTNHTPLIVFAFVREVQEWMKISILFNHFQNNNSLSNG